MKLSDLKAIAHAAGNGELSDLEQADARILFRGSFSPSEVLAMIELLEEAKRAMICSCEDQERCHGCPGYLWLEKFEKEFGS